MNRVGGRWLPLVVLVAAVAALLSSIVWVTAGISGPSGTPTPRGPRHGWMPMMSGPGHGMMNLTPGAGSVREQWGGPTRIRPGDDVEHHIWDEHDDAPGRLVGHSHILS